MPMKGPDEITGIDVAIVFQERARKLAEFAGTHTLGGVWSKYDHDFVDDLERELEKLASLARIMRTKAATVQPKPPASP
jgi:hypothetical protein